MLYVYCLLCEMVCESFEVYGLVTHDLATVRLVLAISSSYNIISHVTVVGRSHCQYCVHRWTWLDIAGMIFRLLARSLWQPTRNLP